MRSVLLLLALAIMVNGLGSSDTITWGGDNSRAGYLTSHNMDPANVGSAQFSQLFRTALPGKYKGHAEQILSQPLVYTPEGEKRQFIYYSTSQNNIYKLCAKTGKILASRNLHIPFLTTDLEGCADNHPTIGIIGTGVIDSDTETLFVIAKTYEDQDGGEEPQGGSAGRYYIHALDVNDLDERPNYPIELEGIVARNNPSHTFSSGVYLQRPALLQEGKYIYASFGSHCVQCSQTEWIIGWDKLTGELVEQFASEGEHVPEDIRSNHVWLSGGGLTSDHTGSMFCAISNGLTSPTISTILTNDVDSLKAMGGAAMHMTINGNGSLSLLDFITPTNKRDIDSSDKDLGTSPFQILPKEFSCGEYERIGMVIEKGGKIHWLNLDNGADDRDNVIQSYQNENYVFAGAGVYPLEGGYIYVNVVEHPTQVFKFTCDDGQPLFVKVAETSHNSACSLGVSHITVTTVDGKPGTGLVWITDVEGHNVRIYEAVPRDGILKLLKSFHVSGATKFTRSVFGDGVLHTGTNDGSVYGFGAPTREPLSCTSDIDFGTTDISDQGEKKPITCMALVGVTIQGIGQKDGTQYSISGLPKFPLQLEAGKKFTFYVEFGPKQVGPISDNIIVYTRNNVEGFSTSTSVRKLGTGKSSRAHLSIDPKNVVFPRATTSDGPNGITELFILGNQGQSVLKIKEVLYSAESPDGPFETWDRQGPLEVSQFTLRNIPKKLDPSSSKTLGVQFDSSISGDFSGYVKFVTNGGDGILSIRGSSGASPTALLQFQTTDGKGWVTYSPSKPFTFGNVTENSARILKMRLTNKAPKGGTRLRITSSNPPFNIGGLIETDNRVDLGEGTSLAPGQSATALLTFSAPKSQWNVDPYDADANWSMDTNDPNFGPVSIRFVGKAVAEQAPPLLRPGEGRYRYIGCFKDNNPDRQLDRQLYGDDRNTNPTCISACASGEWVFCGTEYHRECWGGDRIPSEQVAESNCNFDCSGDSNQICGGNGDGGRGTYISLFADSLQWDGNRTRPDGETNEPGTRPIPDDPVENPGVLGYGSLGCYTEAPGRALPFEKKLETPTVRNCIIACSGDDYVYAGLEYSQECWCGNQLTSGSVPAPRSDCSLACQGNTTELCGGYSRLNLYRRGVDPPAPIVSSSTSSDPGSTTSASSTSTTPITSTPSSSVTSSSTTSSSITSIVSDSSTTSSSTSTASTSSTATTTSASTTTSSSTDPGTTSSSSLSSSSTTTGTSTTGTSVTSTSVTSTSTTPGTSTSATSATSSSTTYSGSATTTSTPSTTTTSSSTTPSTSSTATTTSTSTTVTTTSTSATSTPTTTSTPTSTSTSTSTSTGTSTSTSSTSSTTSPPTSTSTSTTSTTSSTTTTGPPPDPTWVYQGCYTEGSGVRALASKFVERNDMTNEYCGNFCAGYVYYGTEYASQCWCGNVLAGGSSLAANQNDCNAQCSGNPTETCGGGDRLSVYRDVSRTPPTIYPGNANFEYLGCFQEPQAGRLLEFRQDQLSEVMTVQKCLDACPSYQYVGIEVGFECWCANTINYAGDPGNPTPGMQVANYNCDKTCTGDNTQFCGAHQRLTMYQARGGIPG